MKTVIEHLFASRTAKTTLSTLFTLGALALSGVSATAATDTWTGGSVDWNTSSNWNNGAGPVPGSGDTALFNGTGGGNTSITFTSSSSLNSATFDTGSAAAYTIGTTGGATLTLSSGGTIQNTSGVTNAQTVNAPISLGGSYTFANNATSSAATLNFGGTINDPGTATTLTLSGSNSGANTISGAIGGTGAVAKTGTGAWILSGANTYTGTTTVSSGTLSLIGTTGSLASTKLTLAGNGATFVYDNSASSGAKAQGLGAVLTTVGDSSIKNIANGATASTATLTSTTRSSGSTINLTTSGAGASFISSAALAPGSANGNGIFFNGADYAVASAGGTVGVANYINTTGLYRDTASNGNSVNATGVNWLVDGNATVSAGNLGLSTFKFNGSYTVTGGAIFTGGVLVSGGSGTFTGGTFRAGTGFTQNQDIVIRTDTATDSLTIADSMSPGASGVSTGITKTGLGTLVISAANSLTGNNYVNSGTYRSTTATGLGLVAGNGVPLSANALVGTTAVNSGATLDLAPASSMSVLEPIVLSGASLINSGTGVTTLTTGVAGVQFTSSSGISIGGGGNTVTIAGGGGSGATATVSLGLSLGSATISGGTGYAVNDILTVTGGGGTGASYKVATVSGGAITSVTLNAAGSGFTGLPTGFTGGTGTGASFTGNNGAFIVATLNSTAAGSGYTSAPTVSIGSGSLAVTAVIGAVTLNGTNNIIGGTGGLVVNTIIGDGATAGGFTKTGTGTLSLAGANTYSGGTVISTGRVNLSGAGTLGSTTASLQNDATLDLGGTSQTVGAFNGASTGSVLNNGISTTSTLTVGNGNAGGNFAGVIQNGTGTVSLVKTGTGSQVLSGANTYSGGTSVTGGALIVTNTGTTTSATGSGAVSVGAGATIGGTGRSAGTGFSVSGTGTATASRANVLVGQTSLGDTNTSSTLALLGSGASTIANANLTFNINTQVAGGLGTDPANSGNQLSVGNTGITFGAGVQSTVLTLNLQNAGIIAANTPYVLIAGTAVGTSAATSQYSGLNFGSSTGSLSTGLITPILNSNNGGLGNLALSLSGISSTFYGANSYLFLYQNSSTGVDDIEVQFVPEPSTWAMMIGGLAALLFWQRRRNSSR